MSQDTIQHAATWFEIPVSDMARSVAFYEKLLGVTLTRTQCSGEDFAVFPGDETRGVRGALLAVKQVKPYTDGVTIYLNAGPAITPVLARLESCGGKLLTPRTVLPDNQGCYAHIADPDGQRIGLYSLD